MTDAKARGRAYAARKRHAQWMERARGSRTCPAKVGQHGRCGAVLETSTDGRGRLLLTCPRCERRRQGICRDCPAPVAGTVGKALRCAACKRREAWAALERYRRAHGPRLKERARAYTQRPDVRAAKAEYKRLYRQAHPEQVRKYKRAEALRQKAARLAYHKRYNAGRRAAKAAAMQQQYYATTPAPQPTCRSCTRDIPWSARGQKGGAGRPPTRCVFCDARERPTELRNAIKRWIARDERPPRAPAPAVRPLRPKRRQPTRYDASGARLCVVEHCPVQVQGRQKKCTRCIADQRAAAQRVLGSRAA